MPDNQETCRIAGVNDQQLRKDRERQRSLSSLLHQAREEERSAIGREIHDELGQVLATVQLSIAVLAEEYQDHQHLTSRIEEMEQLLAGAIQTVQSISARLWPAMLNILGLAEAVSWQAREFEKKTGISCLYEIFLREENLSRDLSTAVYRIVQEFLTNVIRHSAATRAHLSLKEKENWLILIAKDNGRGITPEQSHDHRSLGILGMKERAQALGGRLKIFSSKPHGTMLIARFPRHKSRR